MVGKTIQIFLPDANPRSVKIAEITSRTVQAILIPRTKLDYIFAREELNNVGVYLLIGNPDEDVKPLLYIGEAEDCKIRLKQHNASKDFWNYAIAIISKTHYFTKTHIKFLESFMYQEAKRINRYKLENSTNPTMPYVSESMTADLMDNFDTIKILVSTLGFPVFDEIKTEQKADLLYCKGKDAHATGQLTDEGFLVFSGSKCNLKEANTLPPWATKMRRRLIEEKILQVKDTVIEFASDHLFDSPSAAATAVLARNANGWIEWRYKNRKTLDEVKRQIKV
ncbi:MAG: GIY-YIG nuclease family protein [Ignavibacteria bacterium]|nr:GIY-YIG nuclease family protein [Ignavibacteria bacterium]MCU7504408.1 GIY-YIG nuclease family protein [Ignavibacteria bacterium]MCU7518151.1 GIY-YIG nuclease family protein [Ignavibacteria bacterium]